MKIAISNFSNSRTIDFDFFNAETCGNLLPQIRYISKLEKQPSFESTGDGFVFKAYLPFNVEIEYFSDSAKEALTVRGDLVGRVIKYWGRDQIIYFDGVDGDIALVGKVLDITDVVVKNSRAGFSVTVSNVPYSLHLFFSDEKKAALYHQDLSARVEFCRRQRFRTKIAVNA